MKIIRTNLFIFQLQRSLIFIAKDKVSASKDFRSKLNKSIKEIIDFPYKYRKSIYFEDESIRDMIFNGYTIIYQIDKIKQQIKILEIFNQNLPKLGINKNENN